MSFKLRLKSFLAQYIPERTIEELAVHSRVLLYTTIPNRLLPKRRRILRQVRHLRRIRLNIGCGSDNPEGWFGVDFLSKQANLRIDVARGLPFRDESCQCIFSEHVFEHFDRGTLRRVLRECNRVLEANGPIRIVMPDLAAYVDAYVKNDGVFSSLAYTTQGHYSIDELMNEIFYVPTHRYVHDFASMERELHRAGFAAVCRCEPGSSRFPFFNIDDPSGHRQVASLYVEAVKADSK
jgi:predicted SAM-dependent methyltransferase